MNFNLNTGYGAALAEALHGQVPVSGKLRIVGDSGTANLDMIKEMFIPDPDGVVRFFSTLDAAISACTANAGDVILVAPGHSETVTSTSIDVDVAGITIVNVGNGDNAPTYTFDSAAATIKIDANNVKWIGGKLVANYLDVASAFTVAAGTNFSLNDSLSEDSSPSLNFLSIVTTGAVDNEADGLTIIGNTWYGLNGTPLAFVSILAAIKLLDVSDNFVNSASVADVGHFITFAAKIGLGTKIKDNILVVIGATTSTVGIFLTGSGTAHTGIVIGNKISSLDTTAELIATAGTGLVYFENYYTGTADTSGKLWPVVDLA